MEITGDKYFADSPEKDHRFSEFGKNTRGYIY